MKKNQTIEDLWTFARFLDDEIKPPPKLIQNILNYLNPIAACQTKANNKKKTGIIGNISTIGLNTIYASGKRDKSKLSIKKTF